MKTNTIISVIVFFLIQTLIFNVKAQVTIGKDNVSNQSVLLEFGSDPKGIILPSVDSAPGAVGGTFIVNNTDMVVQYNDGTNWVNLTDVGEVIENTYVNDGNSDDGDGVIIGAEITTKPGVLVMESTTKALVLPNVADPHLNIPSPVAGTIVYDTTSSMLAIYDGTNWSYWK